MWNSNLNLFTIMPFKAFQRNLSSFEIHLQY